MLSYPKISIITPSYHQGEYIEQTIKSVLDQGYPNLEYIIIDGGSKDDTVAIIKKYEHRLHYWVSEADEGQTDAINKGFAVASGEIINWLNSDDYMEDGSLFKIAAAFTDQKINAITTIVCNFIPQKSISWEEQTPRFAGSIDYIVKGFNNQPGTYFRKAVWDKYFPLPKQLHYTMDQYLWICYWLENNTGDFGIEDFISVHFRRHELSKTSQSGRNLIYNSLGTDFFNNHHLIFWSLFKKHDTLKAKILANHFLDFSDYMDELIEFPKDIKLSSSALEFIFHRYLFVLLKEDYKHGFANRMRYLFKHINPAYLNSDEKNSFHRLKIKAIVFPLIKWYRKIKSPL